MNVSRVENRVENRVEKGGHNVSAEKISSRYYNALNNLISAIEQADKCCLFDNSRQDFRLKAKINPDTMSLEVEPKNYQTGF